MTKEFQKLVEKIGDWDPTTAETFEKEIRAEIEDFSKLEFEQFKNAYNLVVASGYFGPFDRDPDDEENSFSLDEASKIVLRAYDNVRFSDWTYFNPEFPETDDELGNCVIKAKTIHDAFFAQIKRIYG